MQVSEAITKNLKSLFGNGDRIWANVAPEDAKYPMLIYTEDNSDKLNTIDDGFTGHSKVSVRFWVFGKEYTKLKELKDQIVAVMAVQTDLKSCIYLRDQYQFEEQTQSHLIVLEFSMWEKTT